MWGKIDAEALARHPRTRRWGRRFLVAAVLVGLLGFFALPPLVKWAITAKLGEALQREVRVDTVTFNPYTLTATIGGLSVRERLPGAAAPSAAGDSEANPELAGFDLLRVNAELGSLFVAGVIVKEIELVGPRLHLTRDADRRYNISDLIDGWLAKPSDTAPGAPPRFSVSNIQISGGSLVFDDRLEGVRHAVSDLTLRLPFISSLSFHADSYVEPHFSAVVNGAPVQLTGRSRPFADSHESELSLQIEHLQLARYLAYAPVDLPLRIESGALDGTLRLRFVQSAAKASTLTLDGELAVNDFRAVTSDGAPLLASKRLSVALHDTDLIGAAIAVERVAVEAPVVDVGIDPAGKLNWLAMLPPAKPSTKPENPAAAEVSTSPGFLVRHFEIKDGSVRVRDRSTGSEQRLDLNGIQLQAGNFDSTGAVPMTLALALKVDGGERLHIDDIALRDGSVDFKARSIRIGEYSMQGGGLAIERARDGSMRFLRPPQLKTASAENGAGGSDGKPWRVDVDRTSLERQTIRFKDASRGATGDQVLVVDSLRVDGLSSSGDAEAHLQAKLRLNKKGAVDIDGRMQPIKATGALQVDIRDVELLPLQPYFADYLNLRVTRGRLAAKGELSLGRAGDEPAVGYKGSVTVGDFSSVDKQSATRFLSWKSFHLARIDVVSAPLSIAIGDVALSDFFARVAVSPEGKLNLLQIVKGSEAAPEPPTAAAKPAGEAASTEPSPTEPPPVAAADAPAASTDASSPPLPLRIDRVTLQGGRINFSDHFVKPNFAANLTQVSGRVTGLSSKPGSVADLELRGSYDDLAPLTVNAKVNPLAKQPYLDLDAEVKGVELSGFSPYSGKYAGYAIDKGKLSLFLKYKIENGQLVADNRVFLDQLTFGERVDSPDATTLPVTLAVSLLKNRAGEIDINLPISGSLNDPEFSVGGVVVRVIVNLFVKAVTSPFALLGSLFGGGEELAYVEFDPGRAALAPPMLERMQSLAKALADRPGLKIELSGRVDPGVDREGLKRALMMRRVKAQRLDELVRQGVEAPPVDEIEIPAKDYPRYLEKAYKAADFPKPRNFIGFAKSLPVEEMEKLMLSNMPADDEALRRLAERRARLVAQWLTGEGKIAGERVFIVQPHLRNDDGPQQEKAKGSRVDFSLK